MDYKAIVSAIDEYNACSTEEIQREMIDILDTWKFQGMCTLSELTGISKATLYQMRKRCVKYRPSFEFYVRIKSVGKNIYYEMKRGIKDAGSVK